MNLKNLWTCIPGSLPEVAILVLFEAKHPDSQSAGAELYFLWTGEPLQTLAQVQQVQQKNSKISDRLVSILRRAVDPQDPYAYRSITELHKSLTEYLSQIGLTDFSLKDWQKNPEEFTRSSLKKVTEALEKDCFSRIEANTGTVTEVVLHLGLVAPESTFIPKILEAVRQRTDSIKQRRAFAWTLSAGVFIAAGWLGLEYKKAPNADKPKTQSQAHLVSQITLKELIREEVAKTDQSPLQPRLRLVVPKTLTAH